MADDHDEDIDEEGEDIGLPGECDETGEMTVFNGDEIAPTLEQYPYTKRGKKAPYRPLTVPERDMLFAFYEKWNGNMLAISRDRECRFKAYNQIKYWSNLYHFPERLDQERTKRAKETIAGLSEAKLEAVRRAVEMVRPRQVALRDKDGNPVLSLEKQPFFETVYPDQKTLKTAWEIIKTELGEPTWIAKSEVNTPLHEEVRQALDLISKLTEHGGTRDNASDVQGERRPAGDTPEVSPAVQHDPSTQPSA